MSSKNTATVLSREQLMNVLIAPHVTEKTARVMQNHNQYTFKVRRDASKPDIKAAVELMFDVKVAGVQVVNESGKSRRFGKTHGRTQDSKKAYVSLAEGQAIDYERSAKV
jgi:large subunit ribosomal protein L23